jgi:transposase
LVLLSTRELDEGISGKVISGIGGSFRRNPQQVEQVFRTMKSILETRPIFHQRDETIRGHVFCSFLALAMRKELMKCLEQSGHDLEWADIIQDLESLQETTIKENGKRLAVRTECVGTCGKIFQSVKVAIPPTIREISPCMQEIA